MTDKWYLQSKTQERTATGEKFVLITDAPCHLWMRYTFVEPKIHNIAVERRGLPLREDLYFCFDVYIDNEQEEAGDTLTHTFIKEPWPFCQPRWYYYHGEVAGLASPSTTAIFYKHPVAPPGPIPTNDCQPLYSMMGSSCSIWNAAGQIFTPDHDYIAQSLSLILNQASVNYKGPYCVKITLVGGTCWTEPVLFQFNGYSTDLPLPNSHEWVSYPIPNLFLGALTLYRIVVHTTLGWLRWTGTSWVSAEWGAGIQWWIQGAGNPYPRGKWCYGCNFRDSTGSWSTSADADAAFCIYQQP